MRLISDALAWILSPDRSGGSLPLGEAIWTHLAFTFASVAIAAAIAVPLGWYVGHTGRGRGLTVALTGAARAIPSFGLVLLLVVVFGVANKAGAATAAFVLLAVPTILAGTYAGIAAVPASSVDGARAIGMTGAQILFRVEVPQSMPLLVGGIRSAVLQVLATVTIAGYIGNWGLGFYIVQGIQLRDFSQILGASLIIVVLAIALDGLCAMAGRLATPRGLRRRPRTRRPGSMRRSPHPASA